MNRDALVFTLPISVRAKNALYKAGFFTLGDVLDKSDADLLSIKNFGARCLEEVKSLRQPTPDLVNDGVYFS